ncbi:MAG: hypothetical protein IPN01_12505 [Deltaproteobacteria bacterium]|nr:hypothetical protein [Deltaproteobacteria bacterium]
MTTRLASRLTAARQWGASLFLTDRTVHLKVMQLPTEADDLIIMGAELGF